MRLRALSVVLLALAPLAAGCKKRWVEEYVDGLRLLRTRANSQANGTALLELDVWTGETAMLATASVNPGYQVHFRTLFDPEERPIFRAFDWSGTEYSKTNAGYVAEVSTLNWPVSAEDFPLTGGRYGFEFGVVDGALDYVSEPLFVDVLLKTDDDFDRGALKVDIVYVGGLEDDDELRGAMAAALDHWETLYDDIGIEVDFEELTYEEAGDLAPPAFGDGEVYDAISAATSFRGVNVVITPNILAEDDIFGIAGDIPGPLIASSRSAVLISAALSAGVDGRFNAEEERLLAETMAHEVGHFLGLFHPVETSWATWDILDDTDECDAEFDCILSLGTNLMFPFPVCQGFSCTPQGDITPEQTTVVHRYVGVE